MGDVWVTRAKGGYDVGMSDGGTDDAADDGDRDEPVDADATDDPAERAEPSDELAPASIAAFTPTLRDARAVARMVNAFGLTTGAFAVSGSLYLSAIARGGDRLGGIELMLAVYLMWAVALFVIRPWALYRTIAPYGRLTFTFDEDDLSMDGTGLAWTTHWTAVRKLRQGKHYTAMWIGETMVWIPHRSLDAQQLTRLWRCSAERVRGGALFGAGGPLIWVQLLIFGGLPLLFTLGFVVPTVITG